jgi:hypothetical protein
MDSRLVQKLKDLEIPLEEWPRYYAIQCGFCTDKFIEWYMETSIEEIINQYFFFRLAIAGQDCIDSQTLSWFTWHRDFFLSVLRKQNPTYSLLELVDPVDYFEGKKEINNDPIEMFELFFKKVQAINVQGSGI